jgi:hypothetical protein
MALGCCHILQDKHVEGHSNMRMRCAPCASPSTSSAPKTHSAASWPRQQLHQQHQPSTWRTDDLRLCLMYHM